ncbi:MAG: hypothetical protein IJ062_06210 [Firmicutes bacterium]|nr:hypothetical protein [Bacillota bacterium]
MNLEEQYFSEKSVPYRYDILRQIALEPQEHTKSFFLKSFNKERHLDMRMLAMRGYAYYAEEAEIEPLMEKLHKILIKSAVSTPYNYEEYGLLMSDFHKKHFLDTYGYNCFKTFFEQVEKLYTDLPAVYKGLVTCDEQGNEINPMSDEEWEKRWDDIRKFTESLYKQGDTEK